MIESIILSCVINDQLEKQLDQPDIKTVPVMIYINLLLAMTQTSNVTLIQNIIIAQVLVYASVYDIAKHEVDRYLCFFIMFVGCLGISPEKYLDSMMGLLLLPILLLILNVWSEGHYKKVAMGNGDIYIIAVSGFIFGITEELNSLMIGLSLALVLPLLVGGEKPRKKGMPENANARMALVPYLSIGNIITIITNT